jgi:hypothetical protein
MDSPFLLLADKPDHPAVKSYLLYNDRGFKFVQMIHALIREIWQAHVFMLNIGKSALS